MIVDKFELVKNNKFVEISTNRGFASFMDRKILYNIENFKTDEFEKDLKKIYNDSKKEDLQVLEMYFNMKNWLIENHPELLI
jgi:hypothetical protein